MNNADPPQDQVQALLGYCDQGLFQQALASASQSLQQFPDSFILHYLLGVAQAGLGRFEAAIASYNRALTIQSGFAEVWNSLGNVLKEKGELAAAIDSYSQAVTLQPGHVAAWNNLGNVQKLRGDLDAAMASYRQALRLSPGLAELHNNIGNVLYDQGDLSAARDSYQEAARARPGYAAALWNLSGTAGGIDEAGAWIDQCLAADPGHAQARITRAALAYYRGDRSAFDELLRSDLRDHPYTRSCAWVFSLPRLPDLHFSRWALFDAVVAASIRERPFYEFGVWRGHAFRYLVRTFGKGYGFDTFSGLPEDWHGEKAGFYPSEGRPPDIEGGEFIAGKFEDTLPAFFSVPRPMASLINFDADLYSSTLCALEHSKPVIDRHTILVFDELIINRHWEQDEFRALNEFCAANRCTYEVLAVSFYTKQVAVRLAGI